MVTWILLTFIIDGPPTVPNGPPTVPFTYSEAIAQSKRDSKPLIVFVGYPSRSIPGCITVHTDKLDGYPSPCVVVSRGGFWITTLSGRLPTDAEITKAVQPRASPFVDRRPWLAVGEQERLKQLWPKSVSSDGMTFYRPTNVSQRIAITDNRPSIAWYQLDQHDHWRNAPTSFNPNSTKPDWIGSGGLYGIKGWESFKAAYLPDSPRVWKEPIPIANGGMIPGYRWTYPTGTVFADLLVKDGRTFELRLREKESGGWRSYVAFKDRSAAPEGYHGAGKQCASCHDKAGDSEQYGIVLRGSDTVFSFNPFD